MSLDRTPDEQGIGAAPPEVAQSSTGAAGPAGWAHDTAGTGAERATQDMCQKADWLPPAAAGDRLRRWGREYGGYLAAGVLALVVLICAVAGVPGVDMTWHAGNPAPAGESAPLAPGPPSAAHTTPAAPTPAASSPAAPSPAPSRRPTRRPAAAPRTRTSPRPPSPTAGPTMLGPSDSRALTGIVDEYCDRRFDRSAALLRPWPGSGAEHNWSCRRWRRGDVIIADMTDACVVRYGDGAVARYLDAEDPFSWRCYR